MLYANFYKKVISYLAVIACAGSYAFGMQQFDHAAFDKDVVLGGNKTANLSALKRLVQDYNQIQHAFIISIPEFVYIPNLDIKQYMKEQANINLDQCWITLVQKYYPGKREQIQAINSGKLSPDFLNAAAQLANEILNTFITIAEKQHGVNRTELSKETLSENIAAFIQNASKASKLLIVRSTGREDTEKVSNAGGNESIPNVRPMSEDLLRSMGKVIASYLKPKSLTQRINAHDQSIFDLPFIPVLLQHMIGEPQGGFTALEHFRIPRGGVLHTCEQQGKTPHVAHIETTYGNNEAVVNPEHQTHIALDTYYVGQFGFIHASIKPKYKRLVPGNGQLDYASNPANLISVSSLSKTAVQELYLFAQATQNYYGSPQDIEFVVDESSKTIYIVQARPHQKKNFEITPQYLTSLDNIPLYSIVLGKTNTLGDTKVSFITSPDQIIINNTLAEAVDVYQNPNRPKHPLGTFAFTKKWSGQLSHEATVCDNENIKTIVIPDTNLIETWASKSDLFLVADIQRGVVINAQDIKSLAHKTSEQLIDSGIIQQNWLNHPTNMQNSLLAWNAEHECGGLLAQILPQFPADLSGTKYQLLNDQQINNLFETLKECPASKIQEHLATLLSHAYGLLYKERQLLAELYQAKSGQAIIEVSAQITHHAAHTKDNKATKRNLDISKKFSLKRNNSYDDSAAQATKKNRKLTGIYEQTLKPTLRSIHETHAQALNGVFQLILASANEVLACARSVDSASGLCSIKNLGSRSMERLYPLKQLENIFTQLSDKHTTTLGMRSLASINAQHASLLNFVDTHITTLLQENVNLDALLASPSQLTTALMGFQAGLCPATEKAWTIFVNHVCANQQLMPQFTSLIGAIKKLGITSEWINTSFVAAYKNNTYNLDSCLASLWAEFEQSTYLEQFFALQQYCLQQDLASWQNPEYFTKNLPLFINTVLKPLSSGIFADKHEFSQLSAVSMCAANSTMNLFVETIDAMTKSVLSSRQYPYDESLVASFKAMVQQMFSLVQPWGELLPENSLQYFGQAVEEDSYEAPERDDACPLETYVSTIGKIIDTRPLEKSELILTPGFDNLAAAFGSTTKLERHLPKTLHDCFTVTHQTLLNILSALFKPFYKTLDLPEKLILLDKQMLDVEPQGSKMACVGLSFDLDSFSLLYNIPLANHSGQFRVTSHKIKNYIELECRLFSMHQSDLNHSLKHLILFGTLEKYIITEAKTSQQGMRCVFQIPRDTSIDNIGLALTDMFDATGMDAYDSKAYLKKAIRSLPNESEDYIKKILDLLISNTKFDIVFWYYVIIIFKNADKYSLVVDHLKDSISESNLEASCVILNILISNNIPLSNIDECLRILELGLQKCDYSWQIWDWEIKKTLTEGKWCLR